MLLAVGWVLPGCSAQSSMNPVNWWHRQEGGKIAEARPAPPGADQPYPNIATVPAKPTPPDHDALKQLTDSLIADRTNAQHAAQSAPLADPSSPAASPGLFGVGTAPPPPPPPQVGLSAAGTGSPGAPVASASMPGVTAPVAPPSPAPRRSVESTSLEAPAARPETAQNAPASGVVPSSGSSVSLAGPPPALPAGPPPRPGGAGAPPPVPVVPAPMPPPSAGPSATIVFLARDSDLSQPAAEEVKAFAVKRGNGTISVIGFGDAAASDPDAQSSALSLGLSRAQSIVDTLKAAGVPASAIRVSAEASGRGATLQLLQ